MPDLYFQVPEMGTSVVDHVALEMVSALVKDLTLGRVFNRDNISISSDRMADTKISDGDDNMRITANRCDVTLTEITNPAHMRWDMMAMSPSPSYGQSKFNQGDTVPLFADPVGGIRLNEYPRPCNVKLDFSLKFTNKAEAQRIESVITNRYAASSVYNTHDISYSYPIGMDLATALWVLYKLRTSVNVNTEFVDYLKANTSQEIAFEVSKALDDTGSAKSRRLVIKKIQLRTLALLEYDQEKPEPVTLFEHSTDRWEIRFAYTLQFSRPDTLRLSFPTVVENQIVPDTIMPTNEPDEHLYLRTMQGLMVRTSFNHAVRQLSKTMPVLIRMPHYDTFYPTVSVPTKVYGYRPFLIAAFTLDTPTTIIDLQSLGEIVIDATAIDIMKAHGADLFNTIGLFNVSVYANGVLVSPSRLSVDADLKITVNMTDMTKRYHLVISEATRLDHVNGTYLQVLLQYRWFFAMTIMKHVEYLTRQGVFVKIPSVKLIQLIESLFRDRTIDTYSQAMIDSGDASAEIWPMITSPYQYAEYIIARWSLLNPDVQLYTVLMDLLAADGRVQSPYPDPIIRTATGLPIALNMKEYLNGPFTPFRIGFFNIAT